MILLVKITTKINMLHYRRLTLYLLHFVSDGGFISRCVHVPEEKSTQFDNKTNEYDIYTIHALNEHLTCAERTFNPTCRWCGPSGRA